MAPSITIDLVTEDNVNDEYVLYLVEDGPWPTVDTDWGSCLQVIQDRILNAVDAAVDGYVAGKYPESTSRLIRIQIDSPSGGPVQLKALVIAVDDYVKQYNDYAVAIAKSTFIRGLRIVTGEQMGRFKTMD